MRNTLKFFGVCVALVLFLAITINDKTIFNYIYTVISPATKVSQELTQNLVSAAFKKTHGYGKKLFDNSVPTVKSAANSATEIIDDTEKEQLDTLIKNHRK